MKKLMITLAIFIAVLLAAVFIFIPGRIKIREFIEIRAPLAGVSRLLMRDSNWERWWPGNTPFRFNENTYFIRGKILNSIEVDILSGKDSLHSRMDLVQIETDSMGIGWDTELGTSNNPFKRFSKYRQAESLRKDLSIILENMKAFLEKTENIYSIKVNKKIVTDSVLISTRHTFNHQPGIREIDSMIRQLKKYIAANNAVEKNYPMLNLPEVGAGNFEVMVAIPVDRELPETKEFTPKFMLKGGKILETEITGGPFTIKKAFNEFENYRTDYNFSSPAIPYQLLVTDRLKETDTTKWITRLYYPVL